MMDKQPNLRKVIVDFKKLTPEVLKLTVERYPYGYDDNDVISFKNAQGQRIDAVEVLTEDTKYLVKISEKLVKLFGLCRLEYYPISIDDLCLKAKVTDTNKEEKSTEVFHKFSF